MSAPTERHETRALLRAHLAAASGYRHLTRHCPICHRLLRLAMEPLTTPQAPCAPGEPGNSADASRAPETAAGAPATGGGAAPLPHPPRPGDGGHAAGGPAGDPETLPDVRSEVGPETRPDLRPVARPGDEGPPTT
ncbi:DUF6274 family protein [Streptomyces sp. NPDC102282]|uniref:DUF6274 family protein n=1 Tax=Streptomyces sp. NPDC102282 TaxID=3366154 RepID=UPI003822BF94